MRELVVIVAELAFYGSPFCNFMTHNTGAAYHKIEQHSWFGLLDWINNFNPKIQFLLVMVLALSTSLCCDIMFILYSSLFLL